MALLNCVKKQVNALAYYEVEALGYNILEDSKYSIYDRETGKAPNMKLNLAYSEDALIGLVGNNCIPFHIDVMCKSADMIFDMGKQTKIETMLFSSYCSNRGNYNVAEFAIFASNDLDELFDENNKVVYENNGVNWYKGDRNNADWLYDVQGSCRFLGLRIYKSNLTDDIIRPETFGVYCSEYTVKRTYISRNLGKSDLQGQEPKCVTCDKAIADDNFYKLKRGETLQLIANNVKTIDKAWIITNTLSDFTCNGVSIKGEPIIFDRYLYVFDNLDNSNTVTLFANEDTGIEYVGGCSKNKYAKVCLNDVLCDDFYGIGANTIPTSFMSESVNAGYNEVYWELEKKRILLLKPNVVRMWFQPDWLVDTYEQYKSGEYDFNSLKLQSVYKYLDVYKEAGTEIEFNFGWKVSKHAQEWFSFEEAVYKNNSAPRDLDLFAKCCAATLNELVNVKGYSNIKYLTFYNEPDCEGNPIDKGDFVVVGCDRKVYWEKMMRKAKAEMDKYLLSNIKFWGCEESHETEMQQEWLEYVEQNCSDIIDTHTTHRYVVDTKENNRYLDSICSSAKEKPIVITEFGQCYANSEYSFNLNHVQFFIEAVNKGIGGALIWCINSITLTDPCSYSMRNFIDLWDEPIHTNSIDNVREVYYELAQLCRYIPNHSKSLKAYQQFSDDMRVCAFKIGEDDYTIVVELDSARNSREINIDIDGKIGKKMYRHVYKRPCVRNGNALLPPTSAEIFVDEKLRDLVGGDYSGVVYTTLPPVHQIEVAKTEILLRPKETYLLSATNVDGEGELCYEISKQIGDSFKLLPSEPSIIAKKESVPGDMCAIKVYNKNNPEAFAIIIAKII